MKDEWRMEIGDWRLEIGAWCENCSRKKDSKNVAPEFLKEFCRKIGCERVRLRLKSPLDYE